MSTTSPALLTRGLGVSYGGRPALRGVDLSVHPGEVLAVVGESGSGKSTLTRALLGLLPEGAVREGTIELAGIALNGDTAASLRGGTVSLVPQDPAGGLDPVHTIGAQLLETLRLHEASQTPPTRSTKAALRARAVRLLEEVGIDRPQERLRQYPHELSGGLKQRVLIALAFAREPRVLVADEPTSALDVTVQRTVLATFSELAARRGTAVVFVTHDLAVATDLADRVLVLKDGLPVETDTVEAVATRPAAEYTRALLSQALPAAAAPPAAASAAPPAALSEGASEGATATDPREDSPVPALSVAGLTKRYGHGSESRTVVDDVSFELRAGTTFALVGGSGSGKSTTARLILRLADADAGSIRVDGRDVTTVTGTARRELWRQVQLVHQNPDASLDPRWSVERIVAEPLRAAGQLSAAERRQRVAELLDAVRLPADLATARPGRLSGGQRQRVAIARALAVGARTLVLDEALSALDVLTAQHLLTLLETLQAERGLSYLFISHDLGVVERFSHDVGVLSGGVLVETGPTAQVFSSPSSERTRELLRSRPGERLRALVA